MLYFSPVKAGQEPLCVLHLELVQDVAPNTGRGGGPQGHEGDPGEPGPEVRQLLVIWPEVMEAGSGSF